MKLLVATHNENKKIEILHFLERIGGYEVISLSDLGIVEEPEETGSTFKENALLKAKWAMDQTGLMSIADDSGLEIDAFDKEPGVYSARYLGKDTPYPEKNEIILKRLEGEVQRNARFVCAMAIVGPALDPVVVGGTIEALTASDMIPSSIRWDRKGRSPNMSFTKRTKSAIGRSP
jgi:XTP/dITP diphosphohydrolase